MGCSPLDCRALFGACGLAPLLWLMTKLIKELNPKKVRKLSIFLP
jgi:NADH:ubiquinone oxidoreductase subunit E